MQQGQVAGLGGEHRLRDEGEQGAGIAADGVPASPGPECLRVPLLRPDRRPGRVRWDLSGQRFEPGLSPAYINEYQRVDSRDLSRIRAALAVEVQHLLADV